MLRKVPASAPPAPLTLLLPAPALAPAGLKSAMRSYSGDVTPAALPGPAPSRGPRPYLGDVTLDDDRRDGPASPVAVGAYWFAPEVWP